MRIFTERIDLLPRDQANPGYEGQGYALPYLVQRVRGIHSGDREWSHPNRLSLSVAITLPMDLHEASQTDLGKERTHCGDQMIWSRSAGLACRQCQTLPMGILKRRFNRS